MSLFASLRASNSCSYCDRMDVMPHANLPNAGANVATKRRRWSQTAGAVLTVAAALAALPDAARADLKLCNATTGRIGVAVGYQDRSGWATEGWWTIAGQSCEILLKGRLASRFYYIYAVDYDRGGEWSGKTDMCIGDKAFTIKGNDNCEPRGFKRMGFMQVDTNDQRDWTIRLTDPVDTAKEK